VLEAKKVFEFLSETLLIEINHRAIARSAAQLLSEFDTFQQVAQAGRQLFFVAGFNQKTCDGIFDDFRQATTS
jgi:hypothetical protein